MNPTRFQTCLALVLQFEGGFVDDPADHGGRTNHGITQATYSAWLNAHGRPTADVAAIPMADVEAIYEHGYWQACCCDRLPTPLDAAVFDAAVNSGPPRSAKWMQTALLVPADGIIGAGTLAAASSCAPALTAANCISEREAFLRAIGVGNQAKFLPGWLNRLARLRTFCGL